MGKPTGFLEFARELPLDRSAIARINDWNEFHEHMDEPKLKQQGARCMDCGIPFCHTGTLISGMASGCPVNNLIPEWNDLVYRGLWKEALERLHKTNNFPEFTGRVCPAPCEGSCVLGINEPPVTIKNIECAIVDKGWDEGWIQPVTPTTATDKRVAVVGSGPAGLACAQQLRRVGHQVVVFERDEVPGGLLRFGIPDFKLDKDVVERRIQQMRNEGVEFQCGMAVGRDVTLAALAQNFDAVVLAVGAGVARDLPIPGRDLNGVEFAMTLLTEQNRATQRAQKPSWSVEGKRVVILGGGDTGSDCLGTSLRQGATSVTQLELLPAPPVESSTRWPLWPYVFRTSTSQEEGGKRVFGRKTVRFVANEEGELSGLETVQVVFENNVLREVDGTREIIPADVVLLALGFVHPDATAWSGSAVATSDRSTLAATDDPHANGQPFATNIPGVFACGDARRGQSLVVWAIWEGREAARSVDAFLMGASALPSSPMVAIPTMK